MLPRQSFDNVPQTCLSLLVPQHCRAVLEREGPTRQLAGSVFFSGQASLSHNSLVSA